MDKRFGPRSPERRAQMAKERWGDPQARERHRQAWQDPILRQRFAESQRAYAMANLSDRFWKSVDRAGDGCWLWTGCKCLRGYGQTSFPGRGTSRSHRVAWYLTHGEFPPAGVVIRHKCDNPPCCNPDHLELGTNRDNAHDRVKRNRAPQAKLTVDQAQEIRRLKGSPSADVAAKYGLHRDTVANIMAGRTWKSIPWPDPS